MDGLDLGEEEGGSAQKLRILYVASEIDPFLKTSRVAEFVRQLPQAMQERGMEIRILVPRFGLINERRNKLYEVIRLSGINISVAGDEKPLVIKVASVPKAKMQVYFVDNPDYFKRKSVFLDEEDNFHKDNDERTIFFCRSVLETIRRLGWAPDIVHCNDWMTSLVPVYMKTLYREEPVFRDTKCVFSVHSLDKDFAFEEDMKEKILVMNLGEETLSFMRECSCRSLVQLGIAYADAVVGFQDEKEALQELMEDLSEKKRVDCVAQDDYLDEYYNLYHTLSS